MKSALTLILSIGLLAISLPAAPSAQEMKPSGIFLVKSDGAMTPIPGESSGDMQTHGVAKSIMTQGISKPSMTSRFSGAAAPFVITDKEPVFFFRFVDQAQMSKMSQQDPMAVMAQMQGAGGGGMLVGKDAKDYVLGKMTVDGDSRVASSKGMEIIKLVSVKKAPLEFEVRLSKPLEPGQYAFFAGASGAAPMQIWAFTVK